MHHIAARICQGPLVLCPGKKSGCRPWWPQPGSGARRLSPVTWQPGPITALAALNSRGCPTQGAHPGSARSSRMLTTPASSGCSPGVASHSRMVPRAGACQGAAGTGGQYRGHQQVAVLGEGAPLLAGELGQPGHGPSISRPIAAIHLVFRREPRAVTGQAPPGTAPPPFRQVSVDTACPARAMRHRADASPTRSAPSCR